ncbi:GT2 family glycosyltransferase [Lentzea atacamensis]|uniref:GT2 family glycosyltransferase n=1 Tax=Lentzea atacamensis TaxID=531938 RepID=A0A316HHM7_9PSEU|nr:glycosyltransferase [Lentzea atacamensis]PWK80684.1 GT2 family glycosyltransferase [Lentzea atacamensis]
MENTSFISGRADVTVVTFTRNRPHLLDDTIKSVARQCCDHVAAHIILVDDCAETWRFLGKDLPDHVWPRMVPRADDETTGPRRVATLRDIGASLVKTRWMAYLDDDDEWLPNHLHTLLETAERTSAQAVHSWQQTLNRDGTPFLGRYFPWKRGIEAARAEYDRLLGLGMLQEGSNVFRHRVDREEGLGHVRYVDGGEWLLDAEMARRIGFACDFTDEDRANMIAEDDKFVTSLVDNDIPIACTEQATFIYRLGGFSNQFDSQGEPVMKGTSSVEEVSWR